MLILRPAETCQIQAFRNVYRLPDADRKLHVYVFTAFTLPHQTTANHKPCAYSYNCHDKECVEVNDTNEMFR